MRWIVMSVMLVGILSAGIDKKWTSNKNCEGCHLTISKTWETSRHSNSHFSKNDLYKKSIEYIVENSPHLILDEVKISCAKCHNPRITKKYMKSEDKILVALGITEQQAKYTKALNAEHMKNGINCIVCHNVDEVHRDKNTSSGGLHSVKFGEQGTMFGPLDDAKSPYHKTAQRAHFTDNNPTLCFACHYSTKNSHGIEVYATGKEYDKTKDSEAQEGCKSCHMSEKKLGVASNFPIDGKQPRERMVRDHRFSSVDNSDIFVKQVDIKGERQKDNFVITLYNKAPHSIPTGYGLREITLTVKFFDKESRFISEDSRLFGTSWRDKWGKLTIPHLAKSMISDTRIEGKSTNTYTFSIPEGADGARYTFTYRLINADMAKKIGVTDEFFLKEYLLLKTVTRF
ncbi:MAG: multiheme c-type cytochrome [Campylobacterota bacterium]|nr:multiheme c-type cytochrome [Campylobacterota bacterium]